MDIVVLLGHDCLFLLWFYKAARVKAARVKAVRVVLIMFWYFFSLLFKKDEIVASLRIAIVRSFIFKKKVKMLV